MVVDTPTSARISASSRSSQVCLVDLLARQDASPRSPERVQRALPSRSRNRGLTGASCDLHRGQRRLGRAPTSGSGRASGRRLHHLGGGGRRAPRAGRTGGSRVVSPRRRVTTRPTPAMHDDDEHGDEQEFHGAEQRRGWVGSPDMRRLAAPRPSLLARGGGVRRRRARRRRPRPRSASDSIGSPRTTRSSPSATRPRAADDRRRPSTPSSSGPTSWWRSHRRRSVAPPATTPTPPQRSTGCWRRPSSTPGESMPRLPQRAAAPTWRRPVACCVPSEALGCCRARAPRRRCW